MSNILITGAGGFIGSYLHAHYSRIHTVYAPRRSVLDLTNFYAVSKFFDEYKIDTVIHCALDGRDKINAIDAQMTASNLDMFANLWRNKNKFNQLINFGTGNEFDTTTDIINANEHELFNHLPLASYGFAKNTIARICSHTENFYNLRLFGVFHPSESSKRFFRRLRDSTDHAPFQIFQDQEFDFINIEDLVPAVDAVMSGTMPYKDLNMVYPEKYLLSEHARNFAEMHGIPLSRIIVGERAKNNFTGNGSRLQDCGFDLKGLVAGYQKY